MIDADPGTILDNAYPIGKHVLASLVVDAQAVDVGQGMWTQWGTYCPVCGGNVKAVGKTYCIHHDMNCMCLYCPDCWLVYENIEIGRLDDNGDFIPYE